MKKNETARKVSGTAILAVFGCIAVILFECIFIFELYDKIPARFVHYFSLAPQTPPAEIPEPAEVQSSVNEPDKQETPVNLKEPALEEPIDSNQIMPVG